MIDRLLRAVMNVVDARSIVMHFSLVFCERRKFPRMRKSQNVIPVMADYNRRPRISCFVRSPIVRPPTFVESQDGWYSNVLWFDQRLYVFAAFRLVPQDRIGVRVHIR